MDFLQKKRILSNCRSGIVLLLLLSFLGLPSCSKENPNHEFLIGGHWLVSKVNGVDYEDGSFATIVNGVPQTQEGFGTVYYFANNGTYRIESATVVSSEGDPSITRGFWDWNNKTDQDGIYLRESQGIVSPLIRVETVNEFHMRWIGGEETPNDPSDDWSLQFFNEYY